MRRAPPDGWQPAPDLLGDAVRAVFDDLVLVAARALDVPIAAVNVVLGGRVLTQAVRGVDTLSGPLTDAFCREPAGFDRLIHVPDAVADPRFADAPFVRGEPHLRMYAGAPIHGPDGSVVGTLCVADTRPRQLGPDDLDLLARLARMADDGLAVRARGAELVRAASALDEALRVSNTLLALHALTEEDLTPEEMTHAAADIVGYALRLDWTGLIVDDGARLGVVHADHSTQDTVTLAERAVRAVETRPDVLESLLRRTGELFLDDVTRGLPDLPDLHALDVRALAWQQVGTFDGRRYFLCALTVHEPRAWTDADRDVFTAAGRAIADVMVRRRHLEDLEEAAFADGLTGLRNRRCFDRDLDRAGPGFVLVVLDLDGFKCINDRLGHARGDVVLRAFAAGLRQRFRGQGEVYRVGGDEFAVLLARAGHRRDTRAIRATVTAAARDVTTPDLPDLRVSVGIARAEERGDRDALLRLADERMYHDKRTRDLPAGQEGEAAGDP